MSTFPIITADEHLSRLLQGMAEAITEKGYAATTIADVVRHARMSKRTFYEHFADKESAFLATYSAVSDQMLAVLEEEMDREGPWRERVTAALRAYLSALSQHATLTRTFLVEIQAAGPTALSLRREVLQRFAGGLQRVVEELRASRPEIAPLPDPFAMAAIGGINELMLQAVEDGRADRLDELTADASAVLFAVVERRA